MDTTERCLIRGVYEESHISITYEGMTLSLRFRSRRLFPLHPARFLRYSFLCLLLRL